jgi:hypothetical protein
MSFSEELFNTPGIAGAIWCVIISTIAIIYGLTLRWILRGRVDETEKH